MMDKFCSNCGAPLTQGDEFCGQCGQRVAKETVAPPPPPPPAPPSPSPSPATPSAPAPSPAPATPPAPAPAPRKSAVKPRSRSKGLWIVFVVLGVVLAGIAGVGIFLFNLLTGAGILNLGGTDYEDPTTYLPELNRKYTYQVRYTDGYEGTEELWAGRIDGPALMTMTSLIPESEGFTEHILKKNDGLYSVSDTLLEPIRILPDKVVQGASWESAGVVFSILETGASVSTAGMSFDHCIIVRQSFDEAGYGYLVWYAPGVGIVQSLDEGSDSAYYMLAGISDLDPAEVKETLTRYSPNIQQIQ